jgi:hypothetical protein
MTGANAAVGKSTSLKAKKLISEMKAEDAGRGSANSEPGKAMVFRHTTLQRVLKCLAIAQGIKPSTSANPSSALHWSRNAVVLIGTALEKRLRDSLAAARDVVTFGGKQTVTERALIFACSINKDCPSVFQVPAITSEPRGRGSNIQGEVKAAVDRLVTPSAVHRLCVLTGIQRAATSQVVPSLRQATRFFLANIVSNIKSLVELRGRTTISLSVAAMAVGSWARLAGFASTNGAGKRKIKTGTTPAAIAAVAVDPTPVPPQPSPIAVAGDELVVPDVSLEVVPIQVDQQQQQDAAPAPATEMDVTVN